MIKHWAAVLKTIAAFCLLVGCLLAGSAFGEEAGDITAQCAFETNAKPKYGYKLLYDGNYRCAWESKRAKNPYLEVRLPAGQTCSGVQIKWYKVPETWNVEVQRNGQWVSVDGKDDDFLTTYTPLSDVTAFRVAAHLRVSDKLMIQELNVLGPGETPAWVQRWRPTEAEADLLLVVAHPDDEYVFMGGVIPYYGKGQGKRVVVAYLTESTNQRRTELLDGLWTVGQRTYPVMGKFRDLYSNNLKDAYRHVGKQKSQRYLLELIRRFKPEVVVTHDVKGEYGHGAHRLCADALLRVVKQGNDPNIDPDSAQKYGLWQVLKLYIHLWPENRLVMNWHEPLDAFGGRSAYDMAKLGYACHLSQQHKEFRVYDEGPYDSKKFGLAYTLVGRDHHKNDFFENLE